MTSAGITLYGQVIWDPLKLIDHWDNRTAAFFTSFAFTLGTLGTNISANSLSAGNDMTAHLTTNYIGQTARPRFEFIFFLISFLAFQAATASSQLLVRAKAKAPHAINTISHYNRKFTGEVENDAVSVTTLVVPLIRNKSHFRMQGDDEFVKG